MRNKKTTTKTKVLLLVAAVEAAAIVTTITRATEIDILPREISFIFQSFICQWLRQKISNIKKFDKLLDEFIVKSIEPIATPHTYPLLIAALSGPVLGESVGWRRWAAIAVGFVGVVIILEPGFGVFRPEAIVPLNPRNEPSGRLTH